MDRYCDRHMEIMTILETDNLGETKNVQTDYEKSGSLVTGL